MPLTFTAVYLGIGRHTGFVITIAAADVATLANFAALPARDASSTCRWASAILVASTTIATCAALAAACTTDATATVDLGADVARQAARHLRPCAAWGRNGDYWSASHAPSAT